MDRPIKHLHQVDLARRWNLSPRTLERWRSHGVGPLYLKIGGRVVYRIEDVAAFETAQVRQGTVTISARPQTQIPVPPAPSFAPC